MLYEGVQFKMLHKHGEKLFRGDKDDTMPKMYVQKSFLSYLANQKFLVLQAIPLFYLVFWDENLI